MLPPAAPMPRKHHRHLYDSYGSRTRPYKTACAVQRCDDKYHKPLA